MKTTAAWTIFFFLILSMTGGPAWADAWTDYQGVRAEQRAQNRELLKDFRDGKITAQDLENQWKRMQDEAAAAAKRVADDWKEENESEEPQPKEEAQPEQKAAGDESDAQAPAPESDPAAESAAQPAGAESTESSSLSDAAGLTAEPESVEYRNGTETGHVRKMPGLKKFTNIVLKRGTLEDLDGWMLPSLNEIREEALDGTQNLTEDNVAAPKPEADEAELTVKVESTAGDIKIQSRQYEEAREEFSQSSPSLRMIEMWLMMQNVLLMLLLLYRLHWLYYHLILWHYNPFFQIAFGVNPFAAGFGSPLGQDVFFGDGNVQHQSHVKD